MNEASKSPLNVFVASRGNAFMNDIATWLVEAGTISGRASTLVTDRLPRRGEGTNLVVAPHEFFLLHGGSDDELRTAAAASVPLCTEQPGTPWYHLSLGFCRPSKAVLDINAHGVAALCSDGVHAIRLPLGAVPSMNRRRGSGDAGRDIDVLMLAGQTPHRARTLARLAPRLWQRNTELRMFQFTRPVHNGVPGLVFGDEKYDLLARSRILLNIHRDQAEPSYFEWARMVEAFANGCVVVSEPSTGFEPLLPGVHFVETHDLAGAIDELLGDPHHRAAIADAAATAVLETYPLAPTLDAVLAEVEAIPEPGTPRRFRPWSRQRALVRGHKPPLLPAFRPADDLRERTYHALLAEQTLQRRIDQARCVARFGTDDHITPTQTASYATAEPEVTVIVTLFNYAHLVEETLRSIIESTDIAFEVVIVDDHSTDEGRSLVQALLAENDDVPMLLLGSDVNRGLSASRNLAFGHARCAKVMVVDADNMVYPNCLRRLSDALDQHPAAAFAYAILEDFGVEPGVRSSMGWYVPWLCDANYIDAQAMLRHDTWKRHGGYRLDDDQVHGWEDYELWLRLADAGEHGVLVPQMLGRYRTQAASMLTITNLVEGWIRSQLRDRHPSLPWP